MKLYAAAAIGVALTLPAYAHEVKPRPPAALDLEQVSPGVLDHYGMPPKPESGPELDRWRDTVHVFQHSKAPPTPVWDMPGHFHGPMKHPRGATASDQSINWSGNANVGPPGTYGDYHVVQARWYVQQGNDDGTCCRNNWSTAWVGLDGDGSSDVYQGGTECETDVSYGCFGWYEAYPDYTRGLMAVYQGDLMLTDVWHTTSAPHGHICMADQTQNYSICITFDCTFCNGSDFYQGTSAEAIWEMPGEPSPTAYTMPNHPPQFFFNAWDGNSPLINANTHLINMIDQNGNVIELCTNDSSTEFNCNRQFP